MEYCKLQIGCLIVVWLLGISYLKDTWNEKMFGCTPTFDVMLILAPVTIIFDGITAWTVNHMDTVPIELNILLHGAFFISLNAMIVTFFVYYMYQTVGIKGNKQLMLIISPGILGGIAIIATLNKVVFIEGKTTNYSMGIPAYICFSILFLYFVGVCILIGMNHHTLERRKKFNLIVHIIILQLIVIIQMIFPETLLTALVVMLLVLGIYINFENPSFRRIEVYNREMVSCFATLVESKDGSTGGHIRRTQGYVEIILQELKKSLNIEKY